MPYQAQRPSLFGVGSRTSVGPQVDVGGAIDAIAGSANSLVQQAYTRGMQQREMALREQEFQLQQQRETREAAAQTRQLDIAERGAAPLPFEKGEWSEDGNCLERLVNALEKLPLYNGSRPKGWG